MMCLRRVGLLFALILFIFFTASGGKKVIYVSVAPQKYLIERIAGDMYEVEVMVRPGFSPATYEPLPSQIRRLGSAELFLTAGMPFEESWVPRIAEAYPRLLIVDITRDIKKRDIETAESVFGEKEGHVHGRKDPHVWLDPMLYSQMGDAAARVLESLHPGESAVFEKNLLSLKGELERLDRRIREILAGMRARDFAVFHPSWGYFADRYGLRQIPVELSGKQPSPADLEKIVSYMRSKGIHTVFLQREFSSHAAAYVAEQIGGVVAELDPLAYDYQSNMLRTAETLAGGDR